MLLPDGRLWTYSRSDAQRFPTGRTYDARTDHVGFGGGRSFPCGTEFIFLGAVIGKYTFGFADGSDESSTWTPRKPSPTSPTPCTPGNTA